jgi:hypothetical protein
VDKNSVVVFLLPNNIPVKIDCIPYAGSDFLLSQTEYTDVAGQIVWAFFQTDHCNNGTVFCKSFDPMMKKTQNIILAIDFLGYH